jgi:hypothetical protein
MRSRCLDVRAASGTGAQPVGRRPRRVAWVHADAKPAQRDAGAADARHRGVSSRVRDRGNRCRARALTGTSPTIASFRLYALSVWREAVGKSGKSENLELGRTVPRNRTPTATLTACGPASSHEPVDVPVVFDLSVDGLDGDLAFRVELASPGRSRASGA